MHYIINVHFLSCTVAVNPNPSVPCFVKLPVKIPVNPSIKLLSHVLPELGNEANAMAGKLFLLLKTVARVLHLS